MRDRIKLPRVISFWKNERKLWLKFQLNRSTFLFSSLKSVTVNFGFSTYFYTSGSGIRIPNKDPDPIWMQNHPDPKHWLRSRDWSEPYSFRVSGTRTVFGIRFQFQVQENEANNSNKWNSTKNFTLYQQEQKNALIAEIENSSSHFFKNFLPLAIFYYLALLKRWYCVM